MGTEKVSGRPVFLPADVSVRDVAPRKDESPSDYQLRLQAIEFDAFERPRWERGVNRAWYGTESLKAKVSRIRVAESFEAMSAAFDEFAAALVHLHFSAEFINTLRFSMACDRAWFALRRAGR